MISAKESKLTKAQVAAAVKRTVTSIKDGEAVTKEVALKADEVFDWAIRDETDPPTLVVVTVAGEKFIAESPAAKK